MKKIMKTLLILFISFLVCSCSGFAVSGYNNYPYQYPYQQNYYPIYRQYTPCVTYRYNDYRYNNNHGHYHHNGGRR
jgi:hypothetical protein